MASAVTSGFSLLRRREKLSEPKRFRGIRATERANRHIENRGYSHVCRIGPLHSSVLKPRPAIETTRTARASFQALKHYLPRRVHSRTIHRYSSTRRLSFFRKTPPCSHVFAAVVAVVAAIAVHLPWLLRFYRSHLRRVAVD